MSLCVVYSRDFVVTGLLCAPDVLGGLIWAGHCPCCNEAPAQPGRDGSLLIEPPVRIWGLLVEACSCEPRSAPPLTMARKNLHQNPENIWVVFWGCFDFLRVGWFFFGGKTLCKHSIQPWRWFDGFLSNTRSFGFVSSHQLTSRILITDQDELCLSSAGSCPLTLASSADCKIDLIG